MYFGNIISTYIVIFEGGEDATISRANHLVEILFFEFERVRIKRRDGII